MHEASSTAAIVIIGNEILSGKVRDENSLFLCQELRKLGVDVRRILTIPDEMGVIGDTVREASENHTWVFTSGGIGPTHDDITIPAIAQGFNTPTERSEQLAEVIHGYYGEHINEELLRMALIPQGAEVLFDEESRAPQVQFRNVLIFPGVPTYLRHRFLAFRERFRASPIHLQQIFLNCDEGQIAHLLDQTLQAYPDLQLGSYPRTHPDDDYLVKLTLESRQEHYLRDACDFLRQRLPENALLRLT
jgi:molybdenum cofactor synthesis domain-containing protein